MNISIIEFLVFGIIAYFSLIVLIASASRETPMIKTKSGTLIKSMYMIPGIVCCIILAGSGVTIYLDGSSTLTVSNSTFHVLDSLNNVVTLNSTVSESAVKSPAYFTLQNPIWITLHYLFAVIMIVYVLTQVLKMLTSPD